jgi:hypothetical protein
MFKLNIYEYINFYYKITIIVLNTKITIIVLNTKIFIYIISIVVKL